MRKIIGLLMVLCIIAVMGGCGTKETANSVVDDKNDVKEAGVESKEDEEVTTFIFVRPGSATSGHEDVMAAVNEKLLADGVGIQVDIKFIPWDAWQQKINIMLSLGEQIDLLNVMNDWIPLANYVGRGALLDITDLIDEYGENI